MVFMSDTVCGLFNSIVLPESLFIVYQYSSNMLKSKIFRSKYLKFGDKPCHGNALPIVILVFYSASYLLPKDLTHQLDIMVLLTL